MLRQSKTERQNIFLIEWIHVDPETLETHQKLSHTLLWWVSWLLTIIRKLEKRAWKMHFPVSLSMTIFLSHSFQWSLHNHRFSMCVWIFILSAVSIKKGNVRRKYQKDYGTAHHSVFIHSSPYSDAKLKSGDE